MAEEVEQDRYEERRQEPRDEVDLNELVLLLQAVGLRRSVGWLVRAAHGAAAVGGDGASEGGMSWGRM